MSNIFSSENLPLPYGTAFNFDEISYNYKKITDSDVESPLNISNTNITGESSVSVTINGTGLDLSSVEDFYIGWTIRTGSVNYNITDYTYNSETDIVFTVNPSWNAQPLGSLELFNGNYTIKDNDTLIGFQTPYVSTVYLPNAESKSGRYLIIVYGLNRPPNYPLNISPAIGSNDSIDTNPAEEPVTLIYPNDKISLVSSGLDNWIFQ